jgi:hypothetical protein
MKTRTGSRTLFLDQLKLLTKTFVMDLMKHPRNIALLLLSAL